MGVFSGWVFVLKGLGPGQPASSKPESNTAAHEGHSSATSAAGGVIPRSGSSGTALAASQVVPGFLVLADKDVHMYRRDPQATPKQEPLFSGIVGEQTKVDVLGRRVLPSGQVLHVFSVSSASDQFSRSIEIGCSTAEAAHQWVSVLEAASSGKPQASTSLQDRTSSGRSLLNNNVVAIGGKALHAEEEEEEDEGNEAVAWRLIKLVNGLRIFEGVSGGEEDGTRLLKAEGIVEAEADEIFETIMNTNESTGMQWDNVTAHVEVLEVIDGFTDICHTVLAIPGRGGRMSTKEFCAKRTWRRYEDRSYVVSLFPHEGPGTSSTPATAGFKLGRYMNAGYCWEIVPLCGHRRATPGQSNYVCTSGYYARSLVRNVVEVKALSSLTSGLNLLLPGLGTALHRGSSGGGGGGGGGSKHKGSSALAFFKSMAGTDHKEKEKDKGKDGASASGVATSAGVSLPHALSDLGPMEEYSEGVPFHLMCRIAGLREYFAAQPPPVRQPTTGVERSVELFPKTKSLAVMGGEEFFDAIEISVKEEMDTQKREAARKRWQRIKWLLHFGMLIQQVVDEPLTGNNWSVKRELLHNVPPVDVDALGSKLGAMGSVPMAPVPDNLQGVQHSWKDPGGADFSVRGPNYLQDKAKIPAGDPLLKLVAMDWFSSPDRTDNVAARPGCLVQSEAGQALPFIFVINLQVPGPPYHSLVAYFASDRPLRTKNDSFLHRFYANPDDTYRNGRFKLIPRISEGAWMVKRAVGTKPCILGKALKCTYHRGRNYLEMDCDIGSSSVARNVIGIVIGAVTTLVVDLTFLIEAQSPEELPEYLLGAFTCIRIDPKKAVPPPPQAPPAPAQPEAVPEEKAKAAEGAEGESKVEESKATEGA